MGRRRRLRFQSLSGAVPLGLVSLVLGSGCPDRPVVTEDPSSLFEAYAEARCGALMRCGCLLESQLGACVSERRTSIEDFAQGYPGAVALSCLRTSTRIWEGSSCFHEDHEAANDYNTCTFVEPGELGDPCPSSRIDDLWMVYETCAGDLLCDGGVCVVGFSVPDGSACSENWQCSSALCVDQRCDARDVPLGGLCTEHRQCTDAWLYTFCDNGTCAPRLGLDEKCEETEACGVPMACVDGACALVPVDRICQPAP